MSDGVWTDILRIETYLLEIGNKCLKPQMYFWNFALGKLCDFFIFVPAVLN